MATTSRATKRGSYRSSADVRARLLDAAMVEFSQHGFEGSSTRAIARRAGAHQPQINYHFESKEALWYAVMERLIGEIDAAMATTADDPRVLFEGAIRGIVAFSAARPEMNRIMIQEASAPGPRLTWLVETHIRPRHDMMRALWLDVRAAGHGVDVPVELLYHLVIGAASLLHANAPEAELLAGIDASDPAIVEAHADALVRLFLGG